MYTILYDLGTKKKDIQKIPPAIREVIKLAIEKKLTILFSILSEH